MLVAVTVLLMLMMLMMLIMLMMMRLVMLMMLIIIVIIIFSQLNLTKFNQSSYCWFFQHLKNRNRITTWVTWVI